MIALGDSDHNITIFLHQDLENQIKEALQSEHKKFSVFAAAPNLNKLVLETHISSVNALAFAKLHKYYLVSGGSDKSLIIWRIKEDLTYQTLRIIKLAADVTDIVVLPNDEYIFSGCLDNNIYITRTSYSTVQFEQVSAVNLHNSIITSIAIGPNNQNGPIKFAAYVNMNCLSSMMMAG